MPLSVLRERLANGTKWQKHACLECVEIVQICTQLALPWLSALDPAGQ